MDCKENILQDGENFSSLCLALMLISVSWPSQVSAGLFLKFLTSGRETGTDWVSTWNIKLISSRVINHLSDTHLSTQTILTILKYYLQFCRNIRPGASHLVPWLMNLQLFILKLCLNSVHEASLDGMIPSLSVQRMRKFLQVCEMQEELNRTQLSAIWLWWSNLQPV